MTDPIRALRDRQAQRTEDSLAFLSACGLLKYSPAKSKERGRQLTLDIRSRIAHGVPTKGGTNGRHDPRRENLAKATALGEPMLVRKGPLMRGTSILPFQTDTSVLSRAINYGNKALTRKQKRKLRKERKA